jgi:sugar phosphate isomerase/epimerase
MDQRARFVFSGPGSWPLEEAIEWAADHGFVRVDFNADTSPNYPGTFTPSRVEAIRELAARRGVQIGIHTLSAVNMAEITPVMHAAVDEYVRQNFDLAAALGCGYVICHGGYHFSGDKEARLTTAIERMRLATRLAEERGIDIYFENHNREPAEAEIHYLPRDVAETRRFFDAISSPRFRWAFNVAHSYLVPDGPDGFLAAFGAARIGQVRLNDSRARFEEHLIPGEGVVDFRRIFARLAALGYTGPYTLDFGDPDDRAHWRDEFASLLQEIEEKGS